MHSIRLAEMTKLYENIYRAINIGFVNEMKKVCTKMNLEIDEIIKAGKTKPLVLKLFIQVLTWWSLYTRRSFLSNLESKTI